MKPSSSLGVTATRIQTTRTLRMPSFFGDILNAVLALIMWSLVVLVLLYVYRLPAMHRARVSLRKMAVKSTDAYRAESSKMPVEAVQVAENYNHLMEQPTLFYALILYIHCRQDPAYISNTTMLTEAWAYVALRILHSLIQCFYNRITLRFFVFVLSSCVLAHIALTVFAHEVSK